jgi:UDP-N-acetylmuramoylalanine--D-glutamate ligase
MPNGWLLEVSFLATLKGKNCLVFGAGVTGTSVIGFLEEHGAKAILIDEKEITGAITSLESLDLSSFYLAIASPGWKLDHPLIKQARERGVEVISEIDLAWRVKSELRPEQRWLALTGTNGKTTTVQMAEAMLQASGFRARACGNVGDPVIEIVTNSDADVLILELSSFQLSWSREARFYASAILNIADDHIDWHGSFDAYASAKFEIAKMSEILIVNFDDPVVAERSKAVTNRVVAFTLQTPKPNEIGLVENLVVDRAFINGDAEALFELHHLTPAVPHNLLNAMAAAALARSFGASSEAIAKALSQFKLDHHRLEVVLVRDGITWIDDSKATNPHAALAALRSQLCSIWIAGGLAKGAPMEELIKAAAHRIKCAILIGTDANLIAEALRLHAPLIEYVFIDPQLKGKELMLEVVKAAKARALEGDCVLLAPACASMDQFKNYAERGELFATAVKELVDAK